MSAHRWHLERTVFVDAVGGGQIPITSGLIKTGSVTKAALRIGEGPAAYLDLITGVDTLANIRKTLVDQYESDLG